MRLVPLGWFLSSFEDRDRSVGPFDFKFAFRSEKFPEGQRLRLVLRGISDLFTLEEALAHCGIGTIVGTLTDDYSSNAFVNQNNQAMRVISILPRPIESSAPRFPLAVIFFTI